MKTIKKNQFLEMAYNQAATKQANADRRRRLDGRLEEKTLDILADYLPNNVKYNEINGQIKQDYLKENIFKRYNNFHLFNNNTTYLLLDNRNYKGKYYYILVVKATFTGVVKLKAEYIKGQRLTLEIIKEMLANKQAEQVKNLNEIFNI